MIYNIVIGVLVVVLVVALVIYEKNKKGKTG